MKVLAPLQIRSFHCSEGNWLHGLSNSIDFFPLAWFTILGCCTNLSPWPFISGLNGATNHHTNHLRASLKQTRWHHPHSLTTTASISTSSYAYRESWNSGQINVGMTILPRFALCNNRGWRYHDSLVRTENRPRSDLSGTVFCSKVPYRKIRDMRHMLYFKLSPTLHDI